MKKLLVVISLFLLFIPIFPYAQEIGFAPIKIDEKVINFFDFNVGAEVLRYEEAEPDGKKLSKSETVNIIGRFNIYQEFQQFRGGFKGSFPLSVGADTEKWEINNVVNYQTNELEYSWSRIDAYLGYSFKDDYFTIPGVWYTGLRRSEGVQDRSDFMLGGSQINATSREKILSYGLFVGYMGEYILSFSRKEPWSDELKPALVANWQIEYNKPIFNRVTNTLWPGALFTDRVGYTIELKGDLSYHISDMLSVTFNGYGGRMYWRGSSWQNFGSGTVKWPENKTDFLGATVGARLLF
ncbi:MAG: hypothetical protein QME51_02955 [Planctomycetota bacterium]|nr:hypothetical protein [Planctomycetota bacterium]MDI6787312.1 hypothetical protein [Planctomycetota bacterium]